MPQKKEFATAPETNTETTFDNVSPEALIKRILITILVAPDITADQVRSIREVLSSAIPFNPLRGDEMDIQNSSLLQPTNQATPAAPAASTGDTRPAGRSFGSSGSVLDRANAPMLVLVGAFSMVFAFFVAFLFGPVRAFLNRLLAVLPRIGEQAAYTVSNAPAKPAAGGPATIAPVGYGMNGGAYSPTEEEGTRPFRFIREDQLNKLPILFRGMSPAQCALVLAYLPAEWASKVLGTLNPEVQTAVMGELSQAREVPPEVVNEIENQIKSKLPYLVGGVEWIQSVYQLTQPQTQRALLGTLNQQAPELAQTLRQKTFFLEDLNVISGGALRLLVQEVGYPTAALALRDERPESRDNLLKRLPVAMREILQQELDLAGDDRRSIIEAKVRLLDIGRRLLAEGRISLPEAQAR